MIGLNINDEIKIRISRIKQQIAAWDELAKDNEGNKHNLSTSERQDWVDELIELEDYFKK